MEHLTERDRDRLDQKGERKALRIIDALTAEANALRAEADDHYATGMTIAEQLRRAESRLATVEAQRDEWCRQCNMASEHQADTQAHLATAVGYSNRMRAAAEAAEGLLGECVPFFSAGSYMHHRLTAFLASAQPEPARALSPDETLHEWAARLPTPAAPARTEADQAELATLRARVEHLLVQCHDGDRVDATQVRRILSGQ